MQPHQMSKRFLFLSFPVLMILGLTLAAPQAAVGNGSGAPVKHLVLADFEDGISMGQDEFGNDIGFVPWGDTPDNVVLDTLETTADADLALPDQTDDNTVLTVTYDIGAWGGFTHVLTDGNAWISQDWSSYDALSFWLYGNASGGVVQVEIFDNRAPDSTGDTAERFYYRITDDYTGWQHFTIPFTDFQRRTDWQPGGAPDDGLGLTEVSGYAFGFPVGVGSHTAYIDQVEIVGEYTVLNDFEDGVPEAIVVWGDYEWNSDSATTLTPDTIALAADDPLALPDQSGDNAVLAVTFDITSGGYGGFTHDYDVTASAAQDWSGYQEIAFWMRGTGSGGIVQVEIFDNRAPGSTGDTAERFYYRITDDFTEWRFIAIPFSEFQRRTDWQPGGAPDDGFGLSEVWGYAFALPVGADEQTIYLDQVSVFGSSPDQGTAPVVQGPTPTPIPQPTLDPDYPYDGEWALVWSDEFDGPAGTPPDPANWTCETGGWGWGNNEWQYYTDRTDNVAQDGDGALVITAREETLADSECWYGECTHTSARCITMDKFEFTYGRVEARIWLPFGQGIWPAFWMLGANFPEVGWPDSGEIDIMEFIGREPRTTYGTVHGPDYSGAGGIGGHITFDTDVSDDYHVFSIEWEPLEIRWYVDGEQFFTLNAEDLGPRRLWVFDHDFFLLVNLAVGGNWPGYPDDTTTFPQTLQIDWIRVYQRQAN